jgi:hypothetical protein
MANSNLDGRGLRKCQYLQTCQYLDHSVSSMPRTVAPTAKPSFFFDNSLDHGHRM